MEFDNLTQKLYKENFNWVYSIIKDLDKKGIECKEKFTKDPYVLNNVIVLGYYFMNLFIASNDDYNIEERNIIMSSVTTGASSYNQKELTRIYNTTIDLNRIVEDYNSIVRKTKLYSKEDGNKARIVAIDEVYRRIYSTVNKRHLLVFNRVFIGSYKEYESRIATIINRELKEEK